MSASGKNAWLDRVAANAVLTVVMEKIPSGFHKDSNSTTETRATHDIR
jgi:hypothetical protein